jgi:hypothetical protein
MNAWYSDALAAKYQKRARRCLWFVMALAILGLAACIFMCTKVRTGNASQMLTAVILTSVLTGWAAILLIGFVQRPAKAQAGHMLGLMNAEAESLTGTLFLEKGAFRIPGSIVVKKVRLRTEDGVLTFNLNARFAAKLPPEGTPVKVTVRRKFITACEVTDHESA